MDELKVSIEEQEMCCETQSGALEHWQANILKSNMSVRAVAERKARLDELLVSAQPQRDMIWESGQGVQFKLHNASPEHRTTVADMYSITGADIGLSGNIKRFADDDVGWYYAPYVPASMLEVHYAPNESHIETLPAGIPETNYTVSVSGAPLSVNWTLREGTSGEMTTSANAQFEMVMFKQQMAAMQAHIKALEARVMTYHAMAQVDMQDVKAVLAGYTPNV